MWGAARPSSSQWAVTHPSGFHRAPSCQRESRSHSQLSHQGQGGGVPGVLCSGCLGCPWVSPTVGGRDTQAWGRTQPHFPGLCSSASCEPGAMGQQRKHRGAPRARGLSVRWQVCQEPVTGSQHLPEVLPDVAVPSPHTSPPGGTAGWRTRHASHRLDPGQPPCCIHLPGPCGRQARMLQVTPGRAPPPLPQLSQL